ncbi:uncharacterized protein EV422DRAFT_507819 [Fimicolochytrium jonesii]|uniref:uncharacterized protein n=1 Tax=Fimicolochytrium jonesii TaxID=1396493 RepID=UPI0022FF2B43|nr:uncharacterized protein EV422DRAFT_507819 [Fimicolochytrium jonesii]KAI8819009.1 hypothetical protein EV422DRAFT_507819 [Fimicolochytrium jonesii]
MAHPRPPSPMRPSPRRPEERAAAGYLPFPLPNRGSSLAKPGAEVPPDQPAQEYPPADAWSSVPHHRGETDYYPMALHRAKYAVELDHQGRPTEAVQAYCDAIMLIELMLDKQDDAILASGGWGTDLTGTIVPLRGRSGSIRKRGSVGKRGKGEDGVVQAVLGSGDGGGAAAGSDVPQETMALLAWYVHGRTDLITSRNSYVLRAGELLSELPPEWSVLYDTRKSQVAALATAALSEKNAERDRSAGGAADTAAGGAGSLQPPRTSISNEQPAAHGSSSSHTALPQPALPAAPFTGPSRRRSLSFSSTRPSFRSNSITSAYSNASSVSGSQHGSGPVATPDQLFTATVAFTPPPYVPPPAPSPSVSPTSMTVTHAVSPTRRTLTLLRNVANTMTTGAYLSPALYVPPTIWQQPTTKLPSIDTKIALCENVMIALNMLIVNYLPGFASGRSSITSTSSASNAISATMNSSVVTYANLAAVASADPNALLRDLERVDQALEAVRSSNAKKLKQWSEDPSSSLSILPSAISKHLQPMSASTSSLASPTGPRPFDYSESLPLPIAVVGSKSTSALPYDVPPPPSPKHGSPPVPYFLPQSTHQHHHSSTTSLASASSAATRLSLWSSKISKSVEKFTHSRPIGANSSHSDHIDKQGMKRPSLVFSSTASSSPATSIPPTPVYPTAMASLPVSPLTLPTQGYHVDVPAPPLPSAPSTVQQQQQQQQQQPPQFANSYVDTLHRMLMQTNVLDVIYGVYGGEQAVVAYDGGVGGAAMSVAKVYAPLESTGGLRGDPHSNPTSNPPSRQGSSSNLGVYSKSQSLSLPGSRSITPRGSIASLTSRLSTVSLQQQLQQQLQAAQQREYVPPVPELPANYSAINLANLAKPTNSPPHHHQQQQQQQQPPTSHLTAAFDPSTPSQTNAVQIPGTPSTTPPRLSTSAPSSGTSTPRLSVSTRPRHPHPITTHNPNTNPTIVITAPPASITKIRAKLDAIATFYGRVVVRGFVVRDLDRLVDRSWRKVRKVAVG